MRGTVGRVVLGAALAVTASSGLARPSEALPSSADGRPSGSSTLPLSPSRCGYGAVLGTPPPPLRPLIDTLAEAGVEGPEQFAPPRDRPARLILGGFGDRELVFAAARPGSGFFLRSSRFVRAFGVGDTEVRERVSCNPPRDHFFVFIADGVHWSISEAPRADARQLVRRIAAQS